MSSEREPDDDGAVVGEGEGGDMRRVDAPLRACKDVVDAEERVAGVVRRAPSPARVGEGVPESRGEAAAGPLVRGGVEVAADEEGERFGVRR